nr:hypothetical protein [uncultured bacterium]
MHIYYEEGPPTVKMGEAGQFEQGVSRDIDDKLAKQILEKTSIKFKRGTKTKPAPSLVETAAAGEVV